MSRNSVHLMRLLILVEQPAETVTPSDSVDLRCGALGQWSLGSGLAEGPVRPVFVEMVLKLVENGAACRWLMIRMRSRSSRRMVPTKRSAMALARGARTGDLIILMLRAVRTASKAAVNLVSR